MVLNLDMANLGKSLFVCLISFIGRLFLVVVFIELFCWLILLIIRDRYCIIGLVDKLLGIVMCIFFSLLNGV